MKKKIGDLTLKELKAFERIDNTLCLNNIKGKLEFGIDTEEHTDCDSVIGMTEDLETIKQALQRLETIDNSNPSEALECWKWINATIPQWVREKDKEHPNVLEPIKQALLKAQEPKHYLKWEDLEFNDEGQDILVLLNGTKYRMYYWKGYDERINLLTENETSIIHIFEGGCPQDIQFFNDLRLERVEE